MSTLNSVKSIPLNSDFIQPKLIKADDVQRLRTLISNIEAAHTNAIVNKNLRVMIYILLYLANVPFQ